MSILHSAAFFLIGLIAGAGAYIQTNRPSYGAVLPSATAVFETSLQSAITSSATSLTLTANSVRGGGSLAGYNCLTIDEGSAQAEFVCGTVSGTSVTSVSRGISPLTGTTTVSALQFAHRRGANVKITDFPLVQIMKAQANGEDTYPNLLSYTSGTACSGSSGNASICDKAYIDGVAVAGASNANETTKGIVELATGLEAASSTSAGGTAARLAVPTSACTSAGGTAGYWCVITNAAGKIQQSFFNLTELWNFTGTTYIKNLNASSTLAIGGVTYNYPTSQAQASSTILYNDGSGTLTWGTPFRQTVYQNTNVGFSSASTASTTALFIRLPAGTFTSNSELIARTVWFANNAGANCWSEFFLGSGTATTSLFSFNQGNNALLVQSDATVFASSTTSVYGDIQGYSPPSTWTGVGYFKTTGFSLANQTYLEVKVRAINGSEICYIHGMVIESVKN